MSDERAYLAAKNFGKTAAGKEMQRWLDEINLRDSHIEQLKTVAHNIANQLEAQGIDPIKTFEALPGLVDSVSAHIKAHKDFQEKYGGDDLGLAMVISAAMHDFMQAIRKEE